MNEMDEQKNIQKVAADDVEAKAKEVPLVY